MSVSSSVYDQIYNYFYNMTGSSSDAKVLTNSLISMSGTDPLTIIQQLNTATNVNQMKQILLAVFNSNISPVANLGFSKPKVQNPLVQRNILP